MVVFNSIPDYIFGQPCINVQLARIEAIINELYKSLLKAAMNEDISEYSLDDGQTKIRTVYKSSESITKSIEAMKRLKADLINDRDGRVVRMMDSKNFRHGYNR